MSCILKKVNIIQKLVLIIDHKWESRKTLQFIEDFQGCPAVSKSLKMFVTILWNDLSFWSNEWKEKQNLKDLRKFSNVPNWLEFHDSLFSTQSNRFLKMRYWSL